MVDNETVKEIKQAIKYPQIRKCFNKYFDKSFQAGSYTYSLEQGILIRPLQLFGQIALQKIIEKIGNSPDKIDSKEKLESIIKTYDNIEGYIDDWNIVENSFNDFNERLKSGETRWILSFRWWSFYKILNRLELSNFLVDYLIIFMEAFFGKLGEYLYKCMKSQGNWRVRIMYSHFIDTLKELKENNKIPEIIASFEELWQNESKPEESINEAEVESIETENEAKDEIYYDKELQKYYNFLDDFFKITDQIIIIGPPGTGKSYLALQYAAYKVGESPNGSNVIKLVQFHPSYSYEDFIEGYRPLTQPSSSNSIANSLFSIVPGVFKQFCGVASETPNTEFFLIIDEINRGNLSKIFGELIFSLEHRGEELATLQYSKKPFAIPKNLKIIGTMNSLDRSIALMDYALRRRFHFYYLEPDFDFLKTWLEKQKQLNDNQENEELEKIIEVVPEALKKLNKRLENCLGKDFKIGHCYFLKEKVRKYDWKLVNTIWYYQIIPLLEEYTYENKELLRKILNGQFMDGDNIKKIEDMMDFKSEFEKLASS